MKWRPVLYGHLINFILLPLNEEHVLSKTLTEITKSSDCVVCMRQGESVPLYSVQRLYSGTVYSVW